MKKMKLATMLPRHALSPALSRLRGFHGLAAALATACVLAASGAHAAPYVLDPTFAGGHASGSGANAQFWTIDSDWRGSVGYWNETTKTYSSTPAEGFAPIGSFSWGTGMWGLPDWHATRANPAGWTSQWSGTVATINHGNENYANDPNGAAGWGAADALPDGLFATGAEQSNWAVYYNGYIRITEAGSYNFGVLFDDGFFFTLWGADGQSLSIESDFLSPRDRLGFDEDLLLSEGLYRFELGAYDRLEVGVVNLAWNRGGDGDWTTVPVEHLVDEPGKVSAPGTAAAMLAGLIGMGVFRRRRAGRT
jgi:hypothetical protein